VDNLCWAHRGVVHAAKKCLKVRPPPFLRPDRGKESRDLMRVRDAVWINFIGVARGRPSQTSHGVLCEVATLHGRSEN
jgi:hypothetical protein